MIIRKASAISALHPVLFFAGVYIVALLFSIFICSSLFYSCNATKVEVAAKQQAPAKQQTFASIQNSSLIAH